MKEIKWIQIYIRSMSSQFKMSSEYYNKEINNKLIFKKLEKIMETIIKK